MIKKISMIVLLLVVVSAIVVLYVHYTERPSEPVEKLFFSPDPINWVYDNPSTREEDVKIDVFIATEGKTRLSISQQDYFEGDELYSFFYKGIYKGNWFKSEYYGEALFNNTYGLSLDERRQMADENLIMKITNEFDSNDGIINGFILGKREGRKMVFYIFVDEDWKRELSYTNIVWGDNFNDISSMHEREFDFSTFSDGAHIDVIREDVDWYLSSVIKGGIIVGEISKDSLPTYLDDEITVMVVR